MKLEERRKRKNRNKKSNLRSSKLPPRRRKTRRSSRLRSRSSPSRPKSTLLRPRLRSWPRGRLRLIRRPTSRKKLLRLQQLHPQQGNRL